MGAAAVAAVPLVEGTKAARRELTGEGERERWNTGARLTLEELTK
jgi:hypothetical protein